MDMYVLFLLLALPQISLLLLYCCLSYRTANHQDPHVEQGNPSNALQQGQTNLQQQSKHGGLAVPAITGLVIIYKSVEKGEENRRECVICLEELRYGDKCRILEKCKHIYHQACVDSWLIKERHCPLCRHSVRGAHSDAQTRV